MVGKNKEFKEIHRYYTTREKNPLKKMQSLIAVACKLVRVFYVILVKGISYDSSKMLKDIQHPEGKSSFDRNLQKILKLLNMTVEDLMLYHLTASKLLTATVYSQNAPMIHEMNDTAKKQYNLLLDVIDLCAIYY